MFKDIPKKIKIIIPIVIMAIIFLILTISLIRIAYLKNESLLQIEEKIILTVKFSKILHEMQIERGLSIGVVSSKGIKFQQELLSQRKNTDQSIKDLNSFLSHKKKYDSQVLINSVKLQKVRESVNIFSISVKNILDYYSGINEKILNQVTEISKISKLQFITQHIIAYSNFLYFKENVGVERAIGTSIIANKNLQYLEILELNTLIIKQNLYIDNFLKYASSNSISYYKNLFRGDILDEIERMRKVILSTNKSYISAIDVKFWFKYLSIKINTLNKIDNFLLKEIRSDIENELNKTKTDLYLIIFLNIGSILIFILMIGLILNLMNNDKKLKMLLDKYIIRSTTDTRGIIISASNAFCNTSGYRREELIGKQHNIVRHPDMPKSIYRDMWTRLKSGKSWSGTVKNLKKNGDYYWVNAQIEPIKDNSGKITSYVAIRQNITDKIKLDALNYKLEERISREVEKNREKDKHMIQQSRLAQMGEMISMIAHQWRQPLSAISATSASIHFKANLNKLDNDTAIKLSNKILDYSQYLSETIDDFREFFKSNKEKVDTNYTELIQSVLGIIEESMRSQNIDLIQELNCEERFNTYANELKQVILNLIKNAEDVLVENNIEKPYIKIRTYKEDGHFILEISDNGGGVPEDIIDRIFDPYFSTKIKKDGTGLGLYMSKTIVEDHCAGILSVMNSNEGAVFRIKILEEH